MSERAKEDLRFAFGLVTSLFFLWGFSYGLLDVMNKNFQEQLGITKANSGLLQTAYFGAYFIMALPAGWIMQRSSYKVGVIIGLSLYALGALLFIPATSLHSFAFFLFSFFILASGLGFLETAANPYATILGDPATADRRINFSQSFNGLGQSLGPAVGGYFILGVSKTEGVSNLTENMAGVRTVYVGIAVVLIILIVTFLFTKMPDKKETSDGKEVVEKKTKNMWKVPSFARGVVAQFLYVAAQVGVGAFFINYSTSHWEGLSSEKAAYLLTGCFVLFTLGRFCTTGFMTLFKAEKIMGLYAIINIFLLLLVVFGLGKVSVFALMAVFFFMSIMFPSIFSLAVKDLDSYTAKLGSSFIIMAIVGGAIVTPIMGRLADETSIAVSFVLPLACFAYVAWYSLTYSRKGSTK